LSRAAISVARIKLLRAQDQDYRTLHSRRRIDRLVHGAGRRTQGCRPLFSVAVMDQDGHGVEVTTGRQRCARPKLQSHSAVAIGIAWNRDRRDRGSPAGAGPYGPHNGRDQKSWQPQRERCKTTQLNVARRGARSAQSLVEGPISARATQIRGNILATSVEGRSTAFSDAAG
jgi:hypothetical protein